MTNQNNSLWEHADELLKVFESFMTCIADDGTRCKPSYLDFKRGQEILAKIKREKLIPYEWWSRIEKMDNIRYLIWDEVADIYNQNYPGRNAKTLPLDEVFNAVAKLPGYKVTKDGSLIKGNIND